MSLHILGEAYVYVCIFLCVQLHICVQVQVYAGVYMCTCAVEISGQLLSLQQALSTFVFLRQGLSQLTWTLASKIQDLPVSTSSTLDLQTYATMPDVFVFIFLSYIIS